MTILHWDAINPHTGTPYTFDDENLRWGDPSFALDPGDPGFVPYPNQIPTPIPKPNPRKNHTMKHEFYFPTNTAERVLWLENYRSKLSGHAPTLGLTPAECAASIADARWVIYVLGSWLPATRDYLAACTAAAAQVMLADDGSNTNPLQVLPLFVVPALPGVVGPDPAVVPVKMGAVSRIFRTVAQLKKASSYDAVHGQDLGIIGTEDSGPDFALLKPVLSVSILNGHVKIIWNWGGYTLWLDACEIQVDRGDGTGWQLLVIDTAPNHTDPAALPAALTKWKYRAIYNVDGHRVGLWSEEASLVVGG